MAGQMDNLGSSASGVLQDVLLVASGVEHPLVWAANSLFMEGLCDFCWSAVLPAPPIRNLRTAVHHRHLPTDLWIGNALAFCALVDADLAVL